MLRRLLVFISSTADLSEWRDAAARALNDLEIEDSRFESWPSSPNEPMTECLLRVEECDAFVLLLGSRYGSLVGSGLSATHVEYRHALDHRKPVFAYLLKSTSRDREQDTLIEEVRKNGFHCHELGDPATLEAAVRSSLLQEFTRCFRHAHQAPPTAPELQVARVPCATTGVKLPEDPAEAYGLLKNLYENGREEVIHELGTQCQSSFGNSPAIMNFVFMAEVNLGMDGCDVDRHWLAQALSFWASAAAKRRYRQDTLLYCSGNALSVLKRLPAAVKKYRDCLSLNPAFAQCWKNLGTVYVEMGDARSARQCFGEALHLDPQLTQALYSMANLLLIQENDPLGALGYLDRIDGSALPPKWSAGVRGWQAIACIRAGRFAEAIDHSEAAVALDPEAEWAWMVAARHYALARQHNKEWLDRARAFWERFLRRYPDHADAWAEAGYVLWFLRDRRDKEKLSQRALEALTKALQLGLNDDGLAWDRVGHLHQERPDWVEAEKAHREAAAISPSKYGYCHGVSLIFLRRYEEALPLVLAAAEQHQPDARSWFQVAACYVGMGKDEEATNAYQRAIELDPSYAEAWFNLGGLLWNRGRIAAAADVWQVALDRFPDHLLADRVRHLLRGEPPVDV